MPANDILYAMRFKLEAGEAPGEHMAAVRSSTNRALASKHVKQIVDAHNINMPDNKMTVISLTQVTEEEFEKMLTEFRQKPEVNDVANIYEDEKDFNRIIASTPPAAAAEESTESTEP